MTRPLTPAALVVALVATTVSLFPASTAHAAAAAKAETDYARLGVPGVVTVPVLANDTLPEGATVSLLSYNADGVGTLGQASSGPGWQATLTADNQVTIETTTAFPEKVPYFHVTYVLRSPSSGASASVAVTIDRPDTDGNNAGDTTDPQDRYTVNDSISITTTVPGKRVRLNDGVHRDEHSSSGYYTHEAAAIPNAPTQVRASKIAAAALGKRWNTGGRVRDGVPAGIYSWRVTWQRRITVVHPDGISERGRLLETSSYVRVRVAPTGRMRVLKFKPGAAHLG